MNGPIEPAHVMSREKFDTIKCRTLAEAMLATQATTTIRLSLPYRGTEVSTVKTEAMANTAARAIK